MLAKYNKQIGVGVNDFKLLIEQGNFYLDKTLFIRELLAQGTQTSLILRPNGFGKTLNLSMLKYFFDCSGDNSHLFKDTKISKHSDCMKHQGKYPVIYLTLRDLNCKTWDDDFPILERLVQELYKRHTYVLDNDKLEDADRDYFLSILNAKGSELDITFSLQKLCYILYKHFNHKVVVLIDEYDTPIQFSSNKDKIAFNSDYGTNSYVVRFIDRWLSNVLDNNPYLELAVLTGTYQVPRTSLFAHVSNLKVCDIWNEQFSCYFGFSDSEIKEIISYFSLLDIEEYLIWSWYGGYKVGSLKLCNPFSVMSYVSDNNIDKNVHGSNNMLYHVDKFGSEYLGCMLSAYEKELSYDIVCLLAGESINRYVDLDILRSRSHSALSVIYGFLLQAGYVTVQDGSGVYAYDMAITNQESMLFLKHQISDYLVNHCRLNELRTLYMPLTDGDYGAFTKALVKLIENNVKNINSYDTAKFSCCKLIMSLLCGLGDTCQSEVEHSKDLTRFNVTLICRNVSTNLPQLVVCLGFSRLSSADNRKLKSEARHAQLRTEGILDGTLHELEEDGLKSVKLSICNGIAIHGNQFKCDIWRITCNDEEISLSDWDVTDDDDDEIANDDDELMDDEYNHN